MSFRCRHLHLTEGKLDVFLFWYACSTIFCPRFSPRCMIMTERPSPSLTASLSAEQPPPRHREEQPKTQPEVSPVALPLTGSRKASRRRTPGYEGSPLLATLQAFLPACQASPCIRMDQAGVWFAPRPRGKIWYEAPCSMPETLKGVFKGFRQQSQAIEPEWHMSRAGRSANNIPCSDRLHLSVCGPAGLLNGPGVSESVCV